MSFNLTSFLFYILIYRDRRYVSGGVIINPFDILPKVQLSLNGWNAMHSEHNSSTVIALSLVPCDGARQNNRLDYASNFLFEATISSQSVNSKSRKNAIFDILAPISPVSMTAVKTHCPIMNVESTKYV